MNSIASRLKGLLEGPAKRMTGAELARRIGCSQAEVSRWKNGGREPYADDVAKIAGALDVSPSFLLGMTDYTSHPITVTIMVDPRSGIVQIVHVEPDPHHNEKE